jgi:hypothetical protein
LQQRVFKKISLCTGKNNTTGTKYTKLNWHVKVQQMVNAQRNVLRKTNEVQSNMKVKLAKGP